MTGKQGMIERIHMLLLLMIRHVITQAVRPEFTFRLFFSDLSPLASPEAALLLVSTKNYDLCVGPVRFRF